MDVEELTSRDAEEIAALTRAASELDPLSVRDVRRTVFADPGPQAVLTVGGESLYGEGVGVVRDGVGFVKLLAVRPGARGCGVGPALLDAVESFCAGHGAAVVVTGISSPYYVVPGVDERCTEALRLLERRGYERFGEAVNQEVALDALTEPPMPVRRATTGDLDDLLGWVRTEYPQWVQELTDAVVLGTCVLHQDDGFACYDVLREGWFGPMATRPDRQAKGVGTSTLLGALHAMREAGHDTAQIAWVGPTAFYERAAGARLSRRFLWYRKPL